MPLYPFFLSSLHPAVTNHHLHRRGSQTTSNPRRYKSRNKTFPSFPKKSVRRMNSCFLAHDYSFSTLPLENEPSRYHRIILIILLRPCKTTNHPLLYTSHGPPSITIHLSIVATFTNPY